MTQPPEKIWATKSMAVQLNYQHKNVMGEWATEYTHSENAKARIEKLYQTWVHGDLTQTDFNEAFKE